MLIGLIGLVGGAALGLVVGLLLRAGQVTAARTAEARLSDALETNRALSADCLQLQSQRDQQNQQTISVRAEVAHLTTELDHQRQSAAERAPRAWPRPASN